MSFRSGFVCVLGETNAGKSTLINKIIGQKIAIVSPKSQTTRDNLIAVYNDEDSQIVFTDTPGYHKIKNKIDEYMYTNIDRASKDTDVIIYLLSAKKSLVSQFEMLEKYNKKNKAKKIIVVSKIDESSFEKLYPELDKLSKVTNFDILPVSSKNGKNIDILINMIKQSLPEYESCMRYYDVDFLTDKNIRELSREIIREQALLLYDDEIPHGIAVEIDKFEETNNLTSIYATIYVEKENHKVILLGKNGEKIKKLSINCRNEIERLIDAKVYLELFVKVKANWRDDKIALIDLGYKEES